MDMDKIKQNISPCIWGAVVGAGALAIVGFNWGGWLTAANAEEMTQASLTEQLVPICVAQFNMDSEKDSKLADMKRGSIWARGDFVIKQGWATMPGSKEADRKVAADCAIKIAV
ncbi:MAG: hypothetical protein HQ483_03485 [Rhodospirillales bacterium]|nr:hypothetical protein [Rhodospirillales bacterium]